MKPNDQLTAFLGFAPDADPTTPGVLTDTTAMIASTRGLRAFPFGVQKDAQPGPWGSNANFSAYPQGAVQGLWAGLDPQTNLGMVLCKTNLSNAGKVYRLRYNSDVTAARTMGNWEDITPTGTTYVGQAVFTKFGNFVLWAGGASNGARSSLGVQGSATAAGYVTAAPAAAVIAATTRFVMLCNYSATWGGFTDGWVCSARDDHTDWTPSATTLCTYGRLVESDGPITAAIAFGDDIIACKYNSMYIGRFEAGNAEVWVWEKISNSAGARSQLCVASDREGRVYMLGADDLYVWDGAQVKGLMGGVIREWFLANTRASTVSQDLVPGPQVVFDPHREIVLVNANIVGGAEAFTLSYCPRSRLWARASTQYEVFMVGPSGLITWPETPQLFAMKPASGGFGENNLTANRYLYEFSSVQPQGSSACGFTTGDIGSDFYESELKTVRVRDIAGNTTFTGRKAWGMKRPDLLSSLTTAVASTTAKSDGAFDIRQSEKWHRLRFEFNGHVEVTGINLDINKQGAK